MQTQDTSNDTQPTLVSTREKHNRLPNLFHRLGIKNENTHMQKFHCRELGYQRTCKQAIVCCVGIYAYKVLNANIAVQ